MDQPEKEAQAAQDDKESGMRRPLWLWWLGLLVASVCLFAVSDTVADPDLWGHLTFGRDILQTRRVIQQDRYSYLSDRPWINHEWLSELIFASTYQVAGPSGLVALKTVAGLFLLSLGLRQLCREQLNPLASSLFLLLVALALRPGLGAVRPQFFTYVLFACMLILIRNSSRGRTDALWLLVPVFAVWVNLHGGVLAGLAVLCVWAPIKAGMILWGRTSGNIRRFVEVAKIGVPFAVCLFALAFNPYGIGLVRFLLTTATVPRPEISEWAPVSLVSLSGVAYLALLAVSAWGWTGSRKPLDLSLFLVHLATAVAPLLAVRHLPMFALATVILAGEHISEVGNSSLERVSQTERPAAWLIAPIAGTTLIMIVLSFWSFQGIRIEPGNFDFPVRAVAILDRSGIEGNLLVDFDWGEYVIWHLGPQLKVSIDGRRETVYSEQMQCRDADFRKGLPGWEDLLRRGEPSLALLRRGTMSDQRMRQQSGWAMAYEDRICSLFVREGASLWERISQVTIPPLPCDGKGMWFPVADGR